MLARFTALAALLLIVVAGHTTTANDQGSSRAEISDKKPVSTGTLNLSLENANALRTRILFITKKDCEHCDQELKRLRERGGDFEKLRASGWKIGSTPDNHIQIVDRENFPQMIELLNPREYPAVACVSDGEIVRSFKNGCTTPLDVWTFGWLIKGVSERPKGTISEAARVETTGNYRLRGNHWTVEGDPNPTKESVADHLRQHHGNSVSGYGTIENWSYEELRSLHDDIHEREGGLVIPYGRPQTAASNRNLDAFSGSRKAFGR